MHGFYKLRKGVWQSAKKSFKVGIYEKRGPKNVYQFDLGYVWRFEY